MIDGPAGLSGAQLRRRTPRLLMPGVALLNLISASVLRFAPPMRLHT
jgi:hypothetical protein